MAATGACRSQVPTDGPSTCSGMHGPDTPRPGRRSGGRRGDGTWRHYQCSGCGPPTFWAGRDVNAGQGLWSADPRQDRHAPTRAGPRGHVESFGVGSDRQSRVIGYRVCRRRLERCPLSRATVGASQDGRRPRGEPGSRDVCPCRGQKGPKAADSW